MTLPSPSTPIAAVRVLDDIVVLEVSGDDRQSWLQGQVTNDIAGMQQGDARYTFVVNLKGRVIADAWVLQTGEAFRLLVAESAVEPLVEQFERYIIMEDVELDRRDEKVVSVQGSQSSAVAGNDSEDARTPPAADDRGGTAAPLGDHGRDGAEEPRGDHDREGAVERFGDHNWPVDRLGSGGRERLVEAEAAQSLHDQWAQQAEKLGGAAVDAQTWERFRIEQGVPRFGVDFGDWTYPQETGRTQQAVSFNKGCYIGQEPVVMLEHRGKPPKRLCQLRLADGTLALALVRRGDAEVGKMVETESGSGEIVVILGEGDVSSQT